MRSNVELFINGERVDLFGFEDINIVDQIQEVRDVSKIFVPYSREFTVPASKVNNKIFKHYYNYDILNGFDARYKISSEIRINSASYKKGKVTLTDVSLKNDVPYSYKLVFYDNTIDLKNLIGDDMLSDLSNDFLRQYSFTYTPANVFLGFTTGYWLNSGSLDYTGTIDNENDPRDLIFPFISANNYYFYDSTVTGVSPVEGDTESRNINTSSAAFIPATSIKKGSKYTIKTVGTTNFIALGASANTVGVIFHATKDGSSTSGSGDVYVSYGVFLKDLRAGLRVSVIIDAINAQYPDLNLTGDFLDSTNEEFNRLYLYMQKEKGLFEQSNNLDLYLDDATLLDVNEFRPLTSSVVDGIMDNYFELSVTITPNILNDLYNVKIINTETDDLLLKRSAYGVSTFSVDLKNSDLTQDNDEEFTIKVELSGMDATSVDIEYTAIYWEYDPTDEYANRDGYVESNESDYEETSVSVSTNYNVWENMPGIKILDFLTSIFQMFNLTAYVNDDDEIVIQTLDDFYRDGSVVDITKYVDSSKRNVTRNKLYSEMRFEFEEPETFAILNSNEITGDKFGNEVVQDVNEDDYLRQLLAFDGGSYSIKPKFSKILYERMTDQSSSTTNADIGWGWLVDKDQKAVLPKPFLFYADYVDLGAGTTPSSIATDLDTSYGSAGSYYRPSNSLSTETVHAQSLNFGSEFDEYRIDLGNNENSLFNNYWLNYVKGIYDKQSRIITVTAYLPTTIVSSIKLNDEIVIQGRSFYINKIDVNITTGKAQLELITKWDIDLGDSVYQEGVFEEGVYE